MNSISNDLDTAGTNGFRHIKLQRLLLLSLLACGHAGAATIALVADRVIDGNSDDALTQTVVLIDGDRIEAVGDPSIIPADAEVIELPAKRRPIRNRSRG